ncbi:NHL repeat-containing protein [Olivibacter domesticus]|uniref:Lactonase, 7-bladed beta-propeller n=1 Tax=Olivibacter domesticus TaxID=407022 RepID=A0A1H7VQU4_OLID1|nr:hypothetical protein [Olivibacter domesticus]SEM11158.1 hypothetical protein SAMN05661044_04283 [Olivibacter domesticus]
MKRILLYSLLILSIAGIWYACKKADDEPIYPTAPISRLYISLSDLESSETAQFRNVMVIDPADSTVGTDELPVADSYDTDPKRGMGITFDPTIKRVFQVSRNDSTVRLFTVSEAGALTASTSFKDTINLREGRAIAYHRASDQLIVTDNALNASSIHIFSNPLRLTGQRKARKRLLLKSQPYGIALSEKTDSSMMVSMQGDKREILQYDLEAISGLPDSTVADTLKPKASIGIATATDLRGISYSSALDVLVIADIGVVDQSSPDGSIYIIENALSKFATGGTITPDRVISGSNANLMDPIDVAIDDRDDKEHYIYVTDRYGRRISRFLLSANGNTAPNATRSVGQMTPEFIYLDARPRPSLTENSQ